jgi:iron complex transport system permease protein
VSPPLLFTILIGALIGAVVLGLGSGAVSIAPRQVVAIVLDHLGIDTGVDYSATQDAVLWSIRLPRVLLGAVVGVALGIAGVAFQGIFRNPLADPQLIGVSSGAALGSVVAVLAVESVLGSLASPLGGVLGAVAASAAVFGVARHEGRTEVVTLVLAGLAVGALAGSLAAFVVVAADDARVGGVLFYVLGSLGVATWDRLWLTLPFVSVVVVVVPLWARRLDLLLLGEREAMHLGVAVDRVRVVVGGAAAVAVGASVAAAGSIGFVGLVVPHAIRRIAGPSHRILVPAAALGGATAVVLADVIARTIALPLEVPIGLLTAIIGGPVFLVLVARTRREQGGWA